MTDKQVDDAKAIEVAIDRISRAGSPTLQDKTELLELLKSGTLCRVLCQILKESDNKLTHVGRSNLSDEQGLKELIKVQGEAIGLSRAVEYIIEFATIQEETKDA